MRGDFISREGEGVGDLPAMQLGHECGGVGEATSGMIMQELVEGSAKFGTVQAGKV